MIFALLGNLIRLLIYPFHALRRAFAAPAGGWVALEIDGSVVDLPRPRRRGLGFLRSAVPPALAVWHVRELARLVAEDRRVKGLVVHVRSLGAGPSVLASLRAALGAVRAAGKRLVVYLPQGADNRSMVLGSVAERLVVGPETTVAPIGYAVEGRYVRRALERLGIEPEVMARGTYKSAGETLVRDDMSEPQREQLGEVLAAQHATLVRALGEGRGVDAERAARWVDEGPYGARRAAEVGLVDAVAYEDELDRHLDAEPGAQARVVGAGRYLRARRPLRFRRPGASSVVGVVEVHGPIVSRARLGLGGPLASEERLVAALRAARASRRVRAVILHIDSPGGSALASDRIHHEVERLREEKPVVAYLSNVAASGGYYVAAAARVIVAQPQTVTGSIGVVSARLVLGGLLDKLGVTTEVVKRGARADLYSATRALDAGERAVIEEEIDGFYRTFLRVVARGRGRPVEEIEKLAEGRIYSGEAAHARGLVDVLGGFDDALGRARDLAGDASLEPVLVRPPRGPLPPPPLPKTAEAALSALGLSLLGERLTLGMNLEPTERALLYWSGPEGLFG